MNRDPRCRRAQVLAGVIVGVVLGTAHALLTHVVAGGPEVATAIVRAPERPVISDNDRRE